MSYRLLAVALVAACGRYEFDATSRRDAATDAVTDGPPGVLATATHRYRLVDNLADDRGGPSLIGRGGALDGSGFRFAKNQALSLEDAMPVDVYTLDIKVAFDQLGGYVKLVDFKGLSTDEGLYFYNELLRFVVLAASTPTEVSSPPLFAAGRLAEVTLTRNAAGKVVGYVNKAAAIEFVDTTAIANFTRAKQVAHFAIDDPNTNMNEASGGVIRELAIWDRALSATEIASLP